MLSVVKALKQVGDASVSPDNVMSGSLLKFDSQDIHTVTTGVFSHVQFFKETFHQWARHGSTGDDTCAEIGCIEI